MAFKVPVNENNELLESPITPTSSRGDLIRQTSLIIWDEAPMANRAVLHCVEDVCRHVMDSILPFGGKAIVLLGDFRQTCPVIPYGSKAQVVAASIKSSPLWPLFTIARLNTPIRTAADPEYANALDAVGDGGDCTPATSCLHSVLTDEDLIQFVFPPDLLKYPHLCARRSILAPTNRQIDAYNANIISRIEGSSRTYLAADSLMEIEDAGLESPDAILDFVAHRTIPGLPPHTLSVKVGGVYRLMRNFSLDRGLVKNVRAVVVGVGTRLITIRLLRDNRVEDINDILIPRITFTHTLQSKHTLHRRQFPLAPAYATTFNSCQGLTLDKVGVDVTRPVFSHGQLYTALSRVRHRSDGCILFASGSNTTVNVTYEEILL